MAVGEDPREFEVYLSTTRPTAPYGGAGATWAVIANQNNWTESIAAGTTNSNRVFGVAAAITSTSNVVPAWTLSGFLDKTDAPQEAIRAAVLSGNTVWLAFSYRTSSYPTSLGTPGNSTLHELTGVVVTQADAGAGADDVNSTNTFNFTQDTDPITQVAGAIVA